MTTGFSAQLLAVALPSLARLFTSSWLCWIAIAGAGCNEVPAFSWSEKTRNAPATDRQVRAFGSLECVAMRSLSAEVDLSRSQEVRADISRGKDVFYIRHVGNALHVQTKAALNDGDSHVAPMPIIEETADYIKAVFNGDWGVAPLETFVLNKNNGLAIWTKTRPKGFLMQGSPDIQAIYFSCQ